MQLSSRPVEVVNCFVREDQEPGEDSTEGKRKSFGAVEWGILIGSAGWFFTWFLLFCKTFPAVAITEIKEMIPPTVKGSLEAGQ